MKNILNVFVIASFSLYSSFCLFETSRFNLNTTLYEFEVFVKVMMKTMKNNYILKVESFLVYVSKKKMKLVSCKFRFHYFLI